MNLIFFNPNNRLLRHDGDEFKARAMDAVNFFGSPIACPLPKGKDPQKRKFIIDTLRALPAVSVDRLLVFAHGSQKWCEFGGTVSALPLLIPELKRVLKPTARIGLYCCLTGHLDHGGYASSLSALLGGMPVMAHRSSSIWGLLGGHTSDNPYKRMFYRGDTGKTLTNNVVLDGAVIQSAVVPLYDNMVCNMWPTDKMMFRVYRDLLKASKTAEFEMLERWEK